MNPAFSYQPQLSTYKYGLLGTEYQYVLEAIGLDTVFIMQLTTALLVTAGLCTSVYGQGYADECIDIYLKESWLVGTCPTSNGTGTITSSVFLPNKITNTGGTLGVSTSPCCSTEN